MKLNDIPQFPHASYGVDMSWKFLKHSLEQWEPLELDPPFQRGHVWTREQRIAYLEYCLRGGEVSQTIIFNNIQGSVGTSPTVLLDGKQRLTSVLMFLDDKIPAFGHLLSEFEDGLKPLEPRFRFALVKLHTEAEILDLYLSINAGGTPHSEDEIEKVRKMLEDIRA